MSQAHPRFFAICCPRDREAVGSILATLRLSSTPLFLDRDYPLPARKMDAAIRKAIDAAPVVVVFWSAETLSDAKTCEQLKIVRAGTKRTLGVRLDDALLPAEMMEGGAIDFTTLAVDTLEEQDEMLGEYVLSSETREFWYRLRGEDATIGPELEFFEVWSLAAFTLAGIIVAVGTWRHPSEAWMSLSMGLAIGIVFGPLLAQFVARYRARREMDRWLDATIRLYRDPTAERLRENDDRESMSPLEAAALLHASLREAANATRH